MRTLFDALSLLLDYLAARPARQNVAEIACLSIMFGGLVLFVASL